MRFSLKLLAICVSVAPSAVVNAVTESQLAVDQFKTTIDQAISNFEATQLNQWSFQVSRYENEEGDETSSIEHFNPQRVNASQWQLLALNNRAPSADEQRDFQQRKQDSNSNISLQLRELIQTDSLTVISEDNAYIRASFDVYLERLGADASEYLQGILAFAKDGEFIEQITITNTNSFSPMFAATIDMLELNLAFVKINQSILTQSVELEMQGSFALFTEIDEVSSDVYSDYQFIGSCLNC
ncbi:hypothetical protein QTP81_07405 [Alteromonas sp. ASW11-36]|uniref:Uncharacterized protein n=1 Tax=Alteromonas arenosi TaxID=3055817 RepID=A0ABT7SW68_9ALTE|nr:hypothetical protein [Alteromonas sp. ASW11-36]MDM7860418.1 hypothetical protein [Alteromonas sp. ASW11-36]